MSNYRSAQHCLALAALGVVMGACQATEEPSPAPAASVDREALERGASLTAEERLGRHLFFDTTLSEPQGQSCATCHGRRVGFTGPDAEVNRTTVVYPGAVASRFGNRKPPSAAYAPMAPLFTFDASRGEFSGGNFWDGRATGEHLGNPAADQAQGPFLNPLEQNNADAAAVVAKVCGGSYAALFLRVWGADACAVVDQAYDFIGRSIATYEASPEVSAFSSKYDAWKAGQATLSPREQRGLALFEGKAKCSTCHPAPLFTDFTFDNLGVPRNPKNPFYTQLDFNPAGDAWVDPGLAGFLATRPEWADLASANLGKQRVPTLRNVDLRPSSHFVKAYAHNGYFKSLKTVVHFYNTRDVLPTCASASASGVGQRCWPAPEVAANVNRVELGNLGLSDEEEDELVAFLKALSDGYSASDHRTSDLDDSAAPE